jgi:hypothetical protein
MAVRFCQRCASCVPTSTSYVVVETSALSPRGRPHFERRLLCPGCGGELAGFLAPGPADPPAPARPRHREPRLRGGRDDVGPGRRDLVYAGPPISVRRR